MEEAAYSVHIAAAAPDSAHAAAGCCCWMGNPVTGDLSRTKLYTLQEDPSVGATAQQLSFKDDDNNVPQEEHVKLVGGDPIRTPGPQQRGGDDKKHEPPALKQKKDHKENQPGYEACERCSLAERVVKRMSWIPVKVYGYVKKHRSNWWMKLICAHYYLEYKWAYLLTCYRERNEGHLVTLGYSNWAWYRLVLMIKTSCT